MNRYVKRFLYLFFIPLVVVIVFFTGKAYTVKAEEFCSGKHTSECYEAGVAKHVHTDYANRKSTSTVQYTRGGCYTKYHEGYYESRPCPGDMVIFDARMSYGGSNYPCGCINNIYYLQNGGVSVNRPRLQSISYNSDGYTEYYVGECSRCGSTAYVHYNYTYSYRCEVCNRIFSSRGSHTITISSPAYYEADCGKNTNEYYYDNGDGRKAEPVCDRTVIDLIPKESRQVCVFDGECAAINREAVAIFKDGHRENVACAPEGVNNTLFNEWQYINLGYGDYHMESNVIVSGNAKVLVSLYIQGSVNVKVSSSNEAMGEAGFQNGEKTGEFIIGSHISIYADPKPGYHVKHWLNHEGNIIAGSEAASLISYAVPEYDTEVTCIFEPNVYVVKFDAGGGKFRNGEDNISKYCVFSNVYGKVEEPLKSGYRFMGWKYANDIENDSFISTEFTCVSVPDNHTIIAVWAKDGPEYKFISYDDTFEGLYTPERRGYEFMGWFMEEDNENGSGLKADEYLPLKYGYDYLGKSIEKDRNNYIVYAGWTAKKYKVFFRCTENVYLRSSENILNDDGEEIKYHVVRTGVSFDSDSAVKTVTYDGVYGDLPQPGMLDSNHVGMDDYIFAGWSTDGTSEGMIFPEMIVNVDNDINVYPLFVKNGRYEVTLDANGGEMHEAFSVGIAENPFEAAVGSVYGRNLGYYPKCEGKTFVGWNKQKDGLGSRINTTTKVYDDSNHTLYAKWEKYIRYNPNNVDNKGNELVGTVTGATGKHVFVNDDEVPQEVKKNGFYRPYYRFIGWNTERDGSGIWFCSPEDVKDITPKLALTEVGPRKDASVTLYAQWDSTIIIELDYCGGSCNGEEHSYISVCMGDSLPNAVETIPEKENFWFKGFYTGINGSGVCVYNKRGRLCLNGNENAAVMCRENSILTGTVVDSVLQSDSYVSWPEIDKLYACWGEGEEPQNTEIIDFGLIRVNNEPVKKYDESGIPIACPGNKTEFFAKGESREFLPEEIMLSAELRFTGMEGEALRAFATTGKGDAIVTFSEIGKDILAPVLFDLAFCRHEDSGFCFECPIVLPYLTYYVKEQDMELFSYTAGKNTLSGNEPFFYDGDVYAFIHINFLANGEIQGTEEVVKLKIERHLN